MNDEQELEKYAEALEFFKDWLDMAGLTSNEFWQLHTSQDGKCFLCDKGLGYALNLISIESGPCGLVCGDCMNKFEDQI